ncbi:membrane protein insertase YidC, partial [bacterium]|nr:membrane protein insertase YidC [bacterium]
MDKNTIIALIIVGLILLLWPMYMRRVVGVNESIKEQQVQSQINESETGEELEIQDSIYLEEIDEKTQNESSDIDFQIKEPDTLIVNTENFRAELSSLGGGTILKWRLKKYFKGDKKNNIPVELIPDSAEGNLGIILNRDLSDIVFDVEVDTLGEEKTYRFVHRFEAGGRVEKEFVFQPRSYDVEMKVGFFNLNRNDIERKYIVQWGTGFNPTEENIRDDNSYYQAYALQGDELLKIKEGSTEQKEGTTYWVAFRTKYFLMA